MVFVLGGGTSLKSKDWLSGVECWLQRPRHRDLGKGMGLGPRPKYQAASLRFQGSEFPLNIDYYLVIHWPSQRKLVLILVNIF